MRRIPNILPAIVLLSAAAFPLQLLADTSIDLFAARNDGDHVTIEWKTGKETNVPKFDIERAPAGSQQFVYIGTVQAKGDYSDYTFTDETGFPKPLIQQGVYQYRLKIYNTDGTYKYSQIATVEHQTSGVRRTWGQIKEMFR